MEIQLQAWLLITFWAVISSLFLHLGFHALEKTELSNSVSPLVMYVFKHSLAISSCFSSCYALKSRAQSSYVVRSNYVLLVYVFFSVFLPRTIEGMIIWHVVKTIFSWLLYYLLKVFSFLEKISRIPISLFLWSWQYLWKILPVIGAAVVARRLYYLPKSSILDLVYSLASIIVTLIGLILFQIVYSFAVVWFISVTMFFWVPFAYFIVICTYVVSFSGMFWFLYAYTNKFFLLCKNNFSELKTRSGILLALELSLFFVSTNGRTFSPVLVLTITHFFSVIWGELSRFTDFTIVVSNPAFDSQSIEGIVNIATKFVTVKTSEMVSMLNEHKAKKFIEFAIGTVGAILFQNFFRITSFNEVMAFLYFAVMWLANLVLLGVSGGDFGVFNFQLANVVVGCTVGQFGLHRATWLAFGAALLLYGLRLKLESLVLPYEQGQRIRLSFSGCERVHQPSQLPV